MEQAALERFATKGYSATSVAEIARIAEVSERTFFRYFASKDEVLLFRFAENLEQLLTVLRHSVRSPHPRWEDVEHALLTFAEHVPSRSTMLAARVCFADDSPDLRSRLADMTAQWRRRVAETLADLYDRPRGDIEVSILAAIAMLVVTVAWTTWAVEDNGSPAQQIHDAAMAIRRLVAT